MHSLLVERADALMGAVPRCSSRKLNSRRSPMKWRSARRPARWAARVSKWPTAGRVYVSSIQPSSQSTDRIEKNREYAGIPSVERYVMLEQDRIAATVFERDGGKWTGHILFAGDQLAMPEIGLTLPLDELYRGVKLAPRPDAEAEAPPP